MSNHRHLLVVSPLFLAACGGGEGPLATARSGLGAGLLPDIVEEIPNHLNLVNKQQREILRFTSTHWNVGEGPLQIRGGGQIAPCVVNGTSYDQCTFATQEILDANGEVVSTNPAGVAVFHPDHNHWHQSDVADFVLRAGSLAGPVVASGVKVTYCLIDYDKSELVHENSTRVYFDCNAELQGISPGWGDEYHHATHGQDLDITGIPPGTYYLTHDVDPDDHWVEADETNNFSWTSFALSRKGANPEIKELDHSPCDAITCGNTSNK